MSNDYSDQSIDGLENDLLNRGKFATHLADILLLDHGDDCLTVSLEGKWGDGKTSVINLIKGVLKEKTPNSIIIEYNPWLSGSPESLIQDFLLQFSTQLNIENESEDALKVSKKLIAYSSLFSVGKLIPGVEPWASIVEKALSAGGNATDKIAKLKKLDLLGKKKEIEKALEEIQEPIIVIIDDIDRLTPKETFQILRLVKAIADFPRVSFLLAFDANYLIPVLNNNNIVDAHEYINKVIQLRAPLPVISNRGMDSLANSELRRLSDKNLTGHFIEDQDRLGLIWHDFFKPLIKNPRDLKRLFNHLRFVQGMVEDEVCFADLFALSLIATKANLIYEHIKKTPEAYIGQGFSAFVFRGDFVQNVVKHFEDERKEVFERSNFSESDSNTMKGLIAYLFPLVDFDKDSSSRRSEIDTDEAGRVSVFQRLYTALHYTTPIGYISDQEVLGFISGKCGDRKVFLKRVMENDVDERFFDLMKHYVQTCKADSLNILNCIYDVYLLSDKLRVVQTMQVSLSSNLYSQIQDFTLEVIIHSEDQFDLIINLASKEGNAPISAYILGEIKGATETIMLTHEQI